ncbi:MAG: PHP domain-containing protein [Actinobacteria bacterium]|nr:PHP domain-containing protein [Actinomycetota bacterium]
MGGSHDPFHTDGEWLRCSLHAHSSNTDGNLPPSSVAQHHEWSGYDVLSITDHVWPSDPCTVTRVASTDRLLIVPGAELSFDLGEPGMVGEILAFGVEELPADPGGSRDNWYVDEKENYQLRTFADLSSAARSVNDQGGVVYVAHPYWSGLDPHVLIEAEGVAGLEVYNAACELETGRGDSSATWDAVLEAGKTAYALATDDSHYPLFDMAHAATWVRVKDRSVGSVLEALRTGMTYSSAGPVLKEVHRDGDAVEVACSPCRSIVLHAERERGSSVVAGRGGRRSGRILETSEDGLILRAVVESEWPDLRYVRVTATDAYGRSAWTNPL